MFIVGQSKAPDFLEAQKAPCARKGPLVAAPPPFHPPASNHHLFEAARTSAAIFIAFHKPFYRENYTATSLPWLFIFLIPLTRG